MKASLNIRAFSSALAIVTRAGPGGKATIPVLSCVMLSFSKERQRVSMACTNLDVRIETSMAAPVEESGELCVSSSIFTSIIRALPSENVTLTKIKNQIKIESGSSKFSLHAIAASEFPPAPEISGEVKRIEFSQESLLSRIQSVSPAQSDDASRYILNGMFISQQKNAMNFVATDGRRLHLNSVKAESESTASLILPASSVAKLEPLLGSGKNVALTLAGRCVSFEIDREEGDITMYSKVVDGAYPNYKQVIPAGYADNTIKLKRDDLAQAFRRVSLSLSDKNKSVKLALKGTTLTLSASSPEYGDANEDVACENMKNVESELAINPYFVIEALQATNDEHVTLKITDTISPMVLIIGDLLSVIMPIRLS